MAAAILYVASIAGLADVSGLSFLLFPELATLSHDVLTRPSGKWARQPFRLALTPVVTAIAGVLTARHLPYGVPSILLVVGSSIVAIRVLRSTIAPAISAGLLPVVLGIRSWLYVPCVALGVWGLVALLVAWQTLRPGAVVLNVGADADDIDPSRPSWSSFAALALFLIATGAAALVSGYRFILFPPLAVMAYEVFSQRTCSWAGRPFAFVAACVLTSFAGVTALGLLGAGAIAVLCTMIVGVLVLRALRIHLPPALAVGLIPFATGNPTIAYPASVAIGTLSLAAWSAIHRRLRT